MVDFDLIETSESKQTEFFPQPQRQDLFSALPSRLTQPAWSACIQHYSSIAMVGNPHGSSPPNLSVSPDEAMKAWISSYEFLHHQDVSVVCFPRSACLGFVLPRLECFVLLLAIFEPPFVEFLTRSPTTEKRLRRRISSPYF